MHITTSKSYTNISLSEVKEACRIASTDSTYDGELLLIIQAAVDASERYMARSIVYTVALIEDHCQYGQWYVVKEPDIALSAITTYDVNDNPTTIPVSAVTVYKYSTYTKLKFRSGLNATRLRIAYACGWSVEIPAQIKRAIFVKVRELLDQGDQWQQNIVVNTKSWERLLQQYATPY